MKNNYVIIMAGGVGTRFWPFSRANNPKQFHDVLGTGRTLLQQTADRFEGICPQENIFVVTGENYYDLCKEQLPFLSDEQILLEPFQRNTAPCIAYACYKIAARNPNANIVVAPADHIILKQEAFHRRISIAMAASALDNVLITLGIQPTRPDTGYGYIQFEENRDEVKKVKTFREKPNTELAQQFIESGKFVWNAGIFVWNVQAIIASFAENLPAIAQIFANMGAIFYTNDEKTAIVAAYSSMPNISIDNGIMEPANNVYVLLCDIGWSDLGTWKSLYEISEKDEQQNVIDAQVMLYDTKNCLIKTPKSQLVVINGLDGYIVAEYNNVLMICKKDEEQKVKEFVKDALEKGNAYV